MSSRGARNLILLSRSGVKNEAGRALVDELEKQGVRVATPQVDIGDLGSLTNVLAQLAKFMPPVRGCIQATVALRVCSLAPGSLITSRLTLTCVPGQFVQKHDL